MAPLIPHLKRMPRALVALTGILAACGLICIASALLPITWRVGDGILAVTAGALMLLLAIGFYRAQGWARYALPMGLAAMALGSAIRPWPNEGSHQWLGSLFWGIVSYWYLFWKRAVVDYFSGRPDAEPGAPPNGGPAEPSANSGRQWRAAIGELSVGQHSMPFLFLVAAVVTLLLGLLLVGSFIAGLVLCFVPRLRGMAPFIMFIPTCTALGAGGGAWGLGYAAHAYAPMSVPSVLGLARWFSPRCGAGAVARSHDGAVDKEGTSSSCPTKRIEPMRGSAFRLVLYSGVRGALPLMAHPQRWAASRIHSNEQA